MDPKIGGATVATCAAGCCCATGATSELTQGEEKYYLQQKHRFGTHLGGNGFSFGHFMLNNWKYDWPTDVQKNS